MTDYETQTLAVATKQFYSYVGADIIATVALVAAVVGGVVAYRNLKIVRASMLLFLEQDMAARRRAFHDLAADMKSGKPKGDLLERFGEAKESYFNAFERLAALILGRYFDEDEMRRDYHDALKNILREFPGDFGPGTHFRKIKKLHDRWADR